MSDNEPLKSTAPTCERCKINDATVGVVTSAYWDGEKLLCAKCYEFYFQELMRQREGGY